MILCERPSVFQGGAFNRASHKRRWKLDVEEADDSDGCTRPRGPIMDPPNQDFANSLQTFWRYYELRLSLYSIPYFIQLFIHSRRSVR